MERTLIAWVESDPSREIGVDPLRLEYLADRIANHILPDISVLTRRARYLSFLCWAIERTNGASSQIAAIHAIEGQLALFEAQLHVEAAECRAVIGRESVRRRLVSDRKIAQPQRLFKISAFPQYRAFMRALGLIKGRRRVTLTSAGQALAANYRKGSHGRVSCLSALSSPERRMIKMLIGLDRRRIGDDRRVRLYDVLQLLRRRPASAIDEPAEIIGEFGKRPKGSSPLQLELHRAYVWNLMVRGLRVVFLGLVPSGNRAEPTQALRRALKDSLRGRPRLIEESIDVSTLTADEIASSAVAHLRAALAAGPVHLGLEHEACELAQVLIEKRDPDAFIKGLFRRHFLAKGAEQWACLEADGRVRRIAPHSKRLPTEVRSFGYRIDAFAQICRDLKVL